MSRSKTIITSRKLTSVREESNVRIIEDVAIKGKRYVNVLLPNKRPKTWEVRDA